MPLPSFPSLRPLLVLLLLGAQVAGAETYLRDTFIEADGTDVQSHSPELGDPSRWLSTGRGTAVIVSGAAVVTIKKDYAEYRHGTFPPDGAAAIEVRGCVRFTTPNYSDRVTLLREVAESGTTITTYELTFAADGSYWLYRRQGTTATLMNSGSVTITLSETLRDIRLVVGDGVQEVWFDGLRIARTTDPVTPVPGRAGFGLEWFTSPSGVQLDEISASTLDADAGVDFSSPCFPTVPAQGEDGGIPSAEQRVLRVGCGCSSGQAGIGLLGALLGAALLRPRPSAAGLHLHLRAGAAPKTR